MWESPSPSQQGGALVYISLNMKVAVFEEFSLSVTAPLTDWNVSFTNSFLQAENTLSDVLVFKKR